MKPIKICSIDGCDRSERISRGWCPKHYQMWRLHGDANHSRPKIKSRFWAKVNKTETCWEWTAAKFEDGYGAFQLNGQNRRAHRVSYEWVVGEIPDGMLIDHICHNRACVNPSHLRLATGKQNMENRSGAMRNSKSGILGVHWRKSEQRWIGSVTHHGRQIHVGGFRDIKKAEAAVVAKRIELFTHNVRDRIPS